MTRIGNTGVGGPKPAAGPESTESVKETSAASEASQTTNTSTPESPSASSKPSADKHALGDLKSVGTFLRTQLESVLQTKTAKNAGGDASLSPEQKAKADAGLTAEQKAKADKIPESKIPTFAPPYVPVGPVVTGDNLGIPGQPASGDGSVRPNQLPQGQQPQFAPPYVPVGPVVAGDNIGVPGNAAIPERELNFSPDQFQINDQGNLVITNQQLIEYFKSLKENAGGQDIRLGVTNRTPTGEE